MNWFAKYWPRLRLNAFPLRFFSQIMQDVTGAESDNTDKGEIFGDAPRSWWQGCICSQARGQICPPKNAALRLCYHGTLCEGECTLRNLHGFAQARPGLATVTTFFESRNRDNGKVWSLQGWNASSIEGFEFLAMKAILRNIVELRTYISLEAFCVMVLCL